MNPVPMVTENSAPQPDDYTCPPVLLILFNRPILAELVFERIRLAKPSCLYIAVDGPRDAEAHPDDAALVKKCREISQKVDWPCEVKTRFSDENQGCGPGPSNAISWLFSTEETGIILEDDCVPEPSFFRYCAEMLSRYASDPQIMHINGNNFAPDRPEGIFGPYSYGFGRYAQAWGWATWSRAWKNFRYEVEGILKESPDVFAAKGVDRFRRVAHHDRVLTTLSRHSRDVWDYQWQYAVMKRGGLCVAPAVNQISNHGFGEDATHTKEVFEGVTRARTSEMTFPLVHPPRPLESPRVNQLYAGRMLGDAARYRKKALKRWIRGLFGIKKAK